MIKWTIKDHLYTKLMGERSFHLFRDRGMWCFIQRSMTFGNLCGYVAVEQSHPLYGKSHDDMYFQVHGGLTWIKGYVPGIQDSVLGNLWWFGFDTSHAGDARLIDFDFPGRPPLLGSRDTYKDYNYVLTDVYRLADQLADMLPKRHVLIDIEPFIQRLEKLKETIVL